MIGNFVTTGEKIKKLREESGLTQKKLGELSGISESTIRKYELGNRLPKIETLQKIANALNVSTLSLKSDLDLKLENLNFNFQIKVQERTENDFLSLLYSVGFTVTKSDNDIYQVLSDRYKWFFTIPKNELDKLEKSIMDYTLYTTENFFSNFYDDYLKKKLENKEHDEDIINDDDSQN